MKTTGVLENETITIVYCCQDGCVHAGEHTASITLGGKTVSVSFNISKADSGESNDPSDKDIPDTGDHSNLWLWIMLLVISSAGIFASIVYARKRRTESK